MTLHIVQGSPEWHAARLGSFGASSMGALMAKGEGKMRAKLINQIACERLTGKPQKTWEGNDATESGHEQEPLGRRAYEERFGLFVEQVGLIRHPRLACAHASPDGLVGDDGGFELKSHVKFVTHFEAIQRKVSRAHVYQCQWNMACFGRFWWDYGHFCAEAPEHLQLVMFDRIERDDVMIASLCGAIEEAERDVQKLVAEWGGDRRQQEAA